MHKRNKSLDVYSPYTFGIILICLFVWSGSFVFEMISLFLMLFQRISILDCVIKHLQYLYVKHFTTFHSVDNISASDFILMPLLRLMFLHPSVLWCPIIALWPTALLSSVQMTFRIFNLTDVINTNKTLIHTTLCGFDNNPCTPPYLPCFRYAWK